MQSTECATTSAIDLASAALHHVQSAYHQEQEQQVQHQPHYSDNTKVLQPMLVAMQRLVEEHVQLRSDFERMAERAAVVEAIVQQQQTEIQTLGDALLRQRENESGTNNSTATAGPTPVRWNIPPKTPPKEKNFTVEQQQQQKQQQQDSHHHEPPPKLGAEFRDSADSDDRNSVGVEVVSVVPHGAVFDAGIAVGDVIVAFAGKRLSGGRLDLIEAVRRARVGEKTTVTFRRSGLPFEQQVGLTIGGGAAANNRQKL